MCWALIWWLKSDNKQSRQSSDWSDQQIKLGKQKQRWEKNASNSNHQNIDVITCCFWRKHVLRTNWCLLNSGQRHWRAKLEWNTKKLKVVQKSRKFWTKHVGWGKLFLLSETDGWPNRLGLKVSGHSTYLRQRKHWSQASSRWLTATADAPWGLATAQSQPRLKQFSSQS